MRVALAGTGAVAKYFAEELPAVGHEVVILTRSHKTFFDGKSGIVEQRPTDYSSPSKLVEVLKDCDAVVSTISDPTQAYTDVHLAILNACKQTPNCKRFIPAEYYSNSEAYPETAAYTQLLKDALKAQDEIEWTVVSNGWFMNYIIPSSNRYHADIGEGYIVDLAAKKLTIPGTGNERLALTSLRDVAKAVSLLLLSPKNWRPYTYIQGEETTWLRVANAMRNEGGLTDLKVEYAPKSELEEVALLDDSDAAFAASFMLHILDEKVKFDQAKVQRDRDEFFPNLRFITVTELLEEAAKNPTTVL